MQERGRLLRQVLAQELRDLAEPLGKALGPYGDDFHVDASDGIGRKTQLPWARFCSKHMSPSATQGFYCVLHFSTDGSAVHVAVGCSSSKFKEGYSVILPPDELDQRTAWARSIVLEDWETLEPFTDPVDFGATMSLPKSFERACAFVKTVRIEDLDDDGFTEILIRAAGALRVIYDAQREGRELSGADQIELDILTIARPLSHAKRGQGYGLTAGERKAVELQAMKIADRWLEDNGYETKDTSANSPYDFEATKDGDVLLVEVKGTTSDQADAIAMTHGEVAIHQENKGTTALMIVTGIRLDSAGDEPAAHSGALEVLIGWDIDEWLLKPTAYRVSRKTNS